MDIAELLDAYEAQIRDAVPLRVPVGAVVERDGPLVRIHYGTHGRVDYRTNSRVGRRNLVGADLTDVIRRQQAAFAVRREPTEWKVHAHDTPDLHDQLLQAGFVPGWERAVLVARLEDISQSYFQITRPSPGVAKVWGHGPSTEPVHELAAASGPHRIPLAEREADGQFRENRDFELLTLEDDTGLVGACWAEYLQGTEFVAIGGMTGPHPDFQPFLYRGRGRFILAEADGPLKTALEQSAFREVTTVRSYHWAPPGTPSSTRPVKELCGDQEYDALWDRFTARFAFEASRRPPDIAEPRASVTWHLGAADESDIAKLQRIVERGLRASARQGELLYWLDWQHPGYCFDPRRVGAAGQPPWPGSVYPDRDFYLYLAGDLRMGTFGHPWEDSLCVFGEELLRRVEAEITDLLGIVMRRGGRNVGAAWSFGPDEA
ncbi:DUF2716 domain-containing protein [Streptomyces sp. NBC_00079]|uniref:DUF2716 domain-containing protein n=1 Tax=Streptomyces sp. NBC_00079 TaxID=2975644 RepID=UPI00324BA358